jgi:hypothetical protein
MAGLRAPLQLDQPRHDPPLGLGLTREGGTTFSPAERGSEVGLTVVFSMDWQRRASCGAEAAGRRRTRCVTA